MKNNIKSLLCGTAVLALASAAYAVPDDTDAIRYSIDGGTTWSTVITDNGVGDANPGDNHITAIIIAPGITLNVTSSGSSIGTAGSPNLDLGIDGSIGSGSVIVEYSDLGFTPVPSGAFTTHFHVTNTGVTGTEYTIIGSANTLFSGADAPFSGTHIGPLSGSASGDSSMPPGSTAPYAITLVQVLSGSGGISTDSRVTVPDGGNTMMLLGSALSMLGFGASYRKARKASKA